VKQGAPLLRHILCALDVEEPARTALKCAGLIAERFRASLDAVHAPEAGGGLATAVGARRLDGLMARHNLRERLRNLVDAMPGAVRPIPYVVEGRPSSVILAHAEQQQADLIVLGTRQSSRLDACLGNRVANQVPAQASCAVLTVREAPAQFVIRNILVPIDFSACTSPALDLATQFAKKFAANVHIVHVLAQSSGFGGLDKLWRRTDSTLPASALAELCEIEARFRNDGLTATHSVRNQNGVASAILELTDKAEFDLVIMGLHGNPGHADRLTPGVVASVRSRTTVPVLSVRSAAAEVLFAGGGFSYGHHEAQGAPSSAPPG
jgi:nucleotide-binding universal stress UspA family protein